VTEPEVALRQLVEAVLRPLVEEVVAREVEARLGSVSADPSEWLSIPSAAELLGVTEGRVRKLTATRRLPYYSEGPGCRVSIRRADLLSYMAGQRHEARGGAA
jgi:excisionase family DNA binding protein